MRLTTVSAIALIAVAGGVAAQDLSFPTYEEQGLQWTRAPSVRNVARQYQVATRAQPGDRGWGEVACTPDARGQLDCEVVAEEPMNMGYGQAAVNVLERARVAAVDGGSPAGRTFGFRVRFGNWPSRLLPDSFHPTAAGLRWTRRPEMVAWNMRGQGAGDRMSQTYSCLVADDGGVDCAPTGAMTDPDFIRAGLIGLEDARVQRDNGDSASGVRFDWTITVERQSQCGGNQSMRELRGSRGFEITSDMGNAEGNASSTETTCVGAMVQVGNN